MAQFCTECGKPLEDGASFCTECGAKVAVQQPIVRTEAQSEAQMQMTEVVQPEPQVQPVAPEPQAQYIPPVQPIAPQQPVIPKTEDVQPKGKYAVAGTGAYFGLMFLFGIPIIGWLVCFVSAFVMKNTNLKNYAKSKVIWFLIKAVFWVGIFFLFRWVGNMVMDTIGGIFESEFGGLSDLFEQFKGLKDGLGNMEGLMEGLEDLEALEGMEGMGTIPVQ